MYIHFHGLGAMGLPMALRLAAVGHLVRGIDPSPAARARWQQCQRSDAGEHDGRTVEVVILCVSDEAAARAVIEREAAHWPRGTLVIDHTTTGMPWAREAHALLAVHDITYCDAPLSGGVSGAEGGELVAMIGAPTRALPRAQAVLEAYTRQIIHLGDPGAGQACKMANQIAIAGIAAGLETARSFALAQGLPLTAVFAALSQGTAASVQLERLGEKLSDPHAPAGQRFAWLEKDLMLCQAPGMKADSATAALLALCRTHLYPSPTE
jgi:3-hydroxyisobutyrate dehydrogenase-like beta-hydroxyacid dehydrogenase